MRNALVAIVAALTAGPLLVAGVEKPALPSSACLSCHSEADASHGSHVSGIDYARAAQMRQGMLKPPQSASGFGATVAEDMLLDGRVECTSCHDSHDAESDVPDRLRLPETRFAPGGGLVTTRLCLGCHETPR